MTPRDIDVEKPWAGKWRRKKLVQNLGFLIFFVNFYTNYIKFHI